MKVALFAVAVVAFLGIGQVPASAQTVDCSNPQTTKDARDCGDRAYQAADAALNAVYADLLVRLSQTRKAALVKAEQDWTLFRDDHCGFASLRFEGGTAAGPVYRFCLVTVTRSRTRQLQDEIDYLKAL